MEAQMAEMQQSRAVLAEAETSLRQQVSSVQASCPPCKRVETLVCLWQVTIILWCIWHTHINQDN